MPSFSEHEGRYFVQYVTGPSHLSLGLCFSEAPNIPIIVRKSSIGECLHKTDENKIVEAVLAGVKEANQKLKKTLYVSEIIYVENDTPRYELYKYCTYLLAKRFIDLSFSK
jgi:hypothetical protein